MPLSASGTSAQGSFVIRAEERDPYQYQVGFGNRFASEAMYILNRRLCYWMVANYAHSQTWDAPRRPEQPSEMQI